MSLQNIDLINSQQKEISFCSDLNLDFLELSDLSFSVSKIINREFDKVNAVEFLNDCNLFNNTPINWDEISNKELLLVLSDVDKFLFKKLLEAKINLLKSSSSQEIFDVIDSSDALSFTIDEFNSSSNFEDLGLSSNLELFCSLSKLSLDNLLLLNNQNFVKLVRSLILLKLDELDLSEFVLIGNFGFFEEDCKLFFINKFF